MRRIIFLLALVSFGFLVFFSITAYSKSLPPYPLAKKREAHDLTAKEKARKLFYLAQDENRSLGWDECLSRQARKRARQLAKDGYFAHTDPKTGFNPVWDLVITCFRCSSAGENLSKTYQPADEIHKAWMNSTTHRRNILDPRYRLLGVGCYDYICVQLFAGFE